MEIDVNKMEKLKNEDNVIYTKEELSILNRVGEVAREFYNKYYDIGDYGNIDNNDKADFKRTLEKKIIIVIEYN